MLPMSSSNSHAHMEPSWKTYYDAKKLLRQTEQRLKDTREYYPHVHLNSHHETNDLSNSTTSSFMLHHDPPPIHAGSRSMLNDERSSVNKHQLLDSEALSTIRRKISKQKIAAERRAEQLFHSQSDAGHVFESYRPHGAYTTSASLQNLHYSPHRQQRLSPPKPPQPTLAYSSHLSQSQSFPLELDTAAQQPNGTRASHRDNDFERASYHPSTAHRAPRMTPKDNYSLPNGRSTQQRSASASTSLASRYQDYAPSHFLTSNDAQRLKHTRPVEPAHVSSNSGIKPSLFTPDAWRTDPVLMKKPSSSAQQEKWPKKKSSNETTSKRSRGDVEEAFVHNGNLRTDKAGKPKRDTSASKPSLIATDKTPLKPVAPRPKSDDDKKKLQDYMPQKRQHEELFTGEKRFKDEQERSRRDKLKRLNEQLKETSTSKATSAFTSLTPKELTEQTRQRLLRVLGSSADYHLSSASERPSYLERSSSSSSSSSVDSVIEVRPAKANDHPSARARSEPPAQNGATSTNVQRHETLLRWAVNLTRDCDVVENRFKYLRPDGTQPFDVAASTSYQYLQQDDGNLRYHASYYEINGTDQGRPSTVSRSSRGVNVTRAGEYSIAQPPNESVLERRVYRDRAAAKIQAAYRGYSVRKSLPWLNDKHEQVAGESNRRGNQHAGSSAVSVNHRPPLDSTLLRHPENSSATDYHQQQQQQQPSVKKPSAVPMYSDEYDNVPNAVTSNLSTPVNHIRHANSLLSSSSSTTPIPSPEPRVPSQTDRRRSLSPPLPPQMSPDNGRPLHHLLAQPANDSQEARESATRVHTSLSTNTSALQPATRKSPARQLSATSSSSSRKRRSPSPQSQLPSSNHSRHRPAHASSPPTSSSESILTAREKRVRQKFNSDVELQAYEKRLKDIEKKIRQLVKRAFEIFDENRPTASPSTAGRTAKSEVRAKLSNHSPDDSTTTSDELPAHAKDAEPAKKDNDTSSSGSAQRRQSDVVTSDASDLECRVRAYREQLKAKKLELDRLKQRKNKEILRRQEDELKKQIESYDHEIRTLRLQPVQQEQTVPVPSAPPSSSSASSAPKEKSKVVESLHVQQQDDEDKDVHVSHLDTPRDERDTQHDALSISMPNDELLEAKSDHESRRSSADIDRITQDIHMNPPASAKEKEDSVSSSPSSSASLSAASAASKKPLKSQSPHASPSPSASSKSSSSSKHERPKSPTPPVPSEVVPSASSASRNQLRSPSPSSESTPSYSSAHERIQSPSPPPAAFEAVQPAVVTKQETRTPSTPSSKSSESPSVSIEERSRTQPEPARTTAVTRLEHLASPASPASDSTKSVSSAKAEQAKSPIPSSESTTSTASSVDERFSLSAPAEPIKPAAPSTTQQNRSPSPSSESTQASSSALGKLVKIASPFEPSKSIEERSKSPSPPLPSESSTSSAGKRLPTPSPFEPVKSTASPARSIPEHIPVRQVSTTSSKSDSIPTPFSPAPPTAGRAQSVHNDYEEDFSEASLSHGGSAPKVHVDDIDVESIQEEIDDKRHDHDDNRSTTSKSTADEQSEILVLVKKSASTTPRQETEHISEKETSSRLQKLASEDTAQDLSDEDEVHAQEEEDDEKQQQQRPSQVDRLTETLVKSFIDEAINQGRNIVDRKSRSPALPERHDDGSDDDGSDEENNKHAASHQDDDVDNVIERLAIQQDFLEQLDAAAALGNNEQDELNLDLSRLEDKNTDEAPAANTARVIIEEPIKPVVSHTRDEVLQLCHEALNILFSQNIDFSEKAEIDRTVPDSYFSSIPPAGDSIDHDNDDTQRSRRAYSQMIFDLCVELLHEMHAPNIRPAKYPEWQKAKLVSKRFYRHNPPRRRDEVEAFVQKKVLELLNLAPRQITYSKWRTLTERRQDQFEVVLEEELRRTEVDWIDYETDCARIKFDIAEHLFEQLFQEAFTSCVQVINQRLVLSSNSTRS